MHKQEPYDYEQFFADMMSGRRINRSYDIDNNVCLMEVKSCSVRNKGGRTDRFGRFHINIKNHVDLKLDAVKDNKIPLYGLIVKMSDSKDMCIIRSWEHVEEMIDYQKAHNYIQWYKMFGLCDALVRQM